MSQREIAISTASSMTTLASIVILKRKEEEEASTRKCENLNGPLVPSPHGDDEGVLSRWRPTKEPLSNRSPNLELRESDFYLHSGIKNPVDGESFRGTLVSSWSTHGIVSTRNIVLSLSPLMA